MVMWYIAEPFSPSTWEKAHEPMSRSVERSWMAIVSDSAPSARSWKNRSISSERIGPSWYRARRATSGSEYQRWKAVTLPGRCRRSTTRSPSRTSGNHAGSPTGARYTIARMRRWSELAERVASTTRTSEKTGLLADYLRTLDEDELPIAVVFLTGRPFPEADQRATGIGWATIANALGQVAGTDRGELAAAYDRFSDISAAVGDVLANAGHAPDEASSPSLVDVAATFAAIEAASGPARKAELLAGLLAKADPKTARGIVRVLSGELRIGLREGLVEAALAKAFDRPLDAVKRAGMLTGDIGQTAALARAGRLEGAELALFHPLKFMLASPAEDAAEILGRLGPTVWVEDKYDGIRCQLHREGTTVRLYSRDLHDISGGYPEVIAGAMHLPWAGILDGELLAWRDGTVLPFVALQTRLGRKDPSPELLAEVPVIYVAWDVLGLDQPGPDGSADRDGVVAPTLELPLTERRRLLESLELPPATEGGRFALSHLTQADSIDTL